MSSATRLLNAASLTTPQQRMFSFHQVKTQKKLPFYFFLRHEAHSATTANVA
jgi:hypothetical protein